MGKALKSLFRVIMQVTRRSKFYGNKGFSFCNTDVLKLIEVLLGTVNYFIGNYIPLFFILPLFYLFCIY